MPEKFPLQPLLDLANTRMDEVTRQLGELIASERSDQQKLDLLRQYRNEYSQRYVEATREGIGPDTLRNYRAFLARIDEAVDTQQRVVEQARLHTTQGQRQWMAQRTKVRAFDTLSQRFQDELARKVTKQEQRATDEHASRKYRERGEEAG
ncbi:MAG: flagellar export protein FliJ [Azoarcus sp.]|jgi:flagellar FliJ protein|nr:flagellar export protein FliJ [Azoarcus sp.]